MTAASAPPQMKLDPQRPEDAGVHISVLMCAFNTAPYIAAAIQSILEQTFPDLELIVIDDCSTDETWQIIQMYGERDARVTATRTPCKLGAAGALNHGLALCRGQIITRQDSDDLALPERLERQLDFLKTHPDVGAVGCAVYLTGPHDEPLGVQNYPIENDEIQRTLPHRMCFQGASLLMRRSALEQAGFWMDAELSGSEDYDLALRLAEVSSLANLAEPLYVYRQHTASVSHSQRYRQLHRAAIAREKAAYRRYGPQPDTSQLAPAANAYLRAAVLAAGSGHGDEARGYLSNALSMDRTLLDSEQLLYDVVGRYAAMMPSSESIGFVERVFDDLLPRTKHMSRVKNHLLAHLHMAAVFEAAQHRDETSIDAHLWPGIRCEPRWLLNRGVIALIVRRARQHRAATRAESI